MNFIRKRPLLSFMLLVVLTPYGILLPLLWAGIEQETLKPLKLPFALTPLLYACFVSWCIDGEEGIAKLFSKSWNPKTSYFWYAAAASVFIVIGFVSLGLRFTVDGFFPQRSEFASLSTIAAMALPLLLFPGITEEFAWRGFLQSGLQQKINWWQSAFLVGIVWGSWHGFDFLLGNWTFTWTTFWAYPPFILSNSIVIGWVYKNAGESVAVAILAHFSSNCVNFFMPVFEEYNGSMLPAIFYIGGLCIFALLLPLIDIAIVQCNNVTKRGSDERL